MATLSETHGLYNICNLQCKEMPFSSINIYMYAVLPDINKHCTAVVQHDI